jgi:OFA family oxalate/formate antiporter-like MFS transporter
MIDPPAGYAPDGYYPQGTGQTYDPATTGQSGGGLKYAMMWLFFFCNIVAGIMFIGFQSPMLQSILKGADATWSVERLAACGATLIAVSSIFNGLGRFFWGGLSDRIGRIQTFRTMLGTQIIVFAVLAMHGDRINPWLFSCLVCYVLFCYGGGFGTMPSLVLDVFGAKLMPLIYGSILTAWGIGGIVGPQLVAQITDRVVVAAQRPVWSFSVGAGFLLVGFLTSLAMKSGKRAASA